MTTEHDDHSRDEDATVYRDDATILRAPSVHTTTSSSWSAGESSGADEADAPEILKQRFVLEEKIGSGGMGSVYRARDLRKVEAKDTNPYVAIKILNNDFRAHPEAFVALEREASKSQTLRHTNIVSIFDFDKDADVPFITMELLEGEELADLLRHYPTGMPADLAWPVIEGMIAGLDHAHTEGVVHADLKPGNVYVAGTQTAKILDFGIARAMRSNERGEETHFDPKRLAALTPAYASREMLNGDNAEPRDDLYSFGVVVYMMLSGRHPFGRLPANEAHSEGLKPERLSNVSMRQWRVIKKCLAFNRQDRPASAEFVMRELFAGPIWRSPSVALAATIAAVGIGVAVLYEPPDIDEVRQEVRQQTQVESQVDRIDRMLSAPVFDGHWEQEVLVELDRLRHLDFLNEDNLALQAQAGQIFQSQLVRLEKLQEQEALLELVSQFGGLPGVEEAYLNVLVAEYAALATEEVNADWAQKASLVLQISNARFSGDAQVVVAQSQLAEVVDQRLPDLIGEQTELAASLWSVFGPLLPESVNDARFAEIQAALVDAREAKADADFQENRRDALAPLDRLLAQSCMRVDVSDVSRAVRRVPEAHRKNGRTQALKRFDACLTRLALVEVTAAEEMQREVQKYFGEAAARGMDPCRLVDAGVGRGRRNVCSDAVRNVAGATTGPDLVVIPAADVGADGFAISKYEISWQDFNPFCEEQGSCTPGEARLPVDGVAPSLIEQFASWLSDKTGFQYRLPTRGEWLQAAIGEPDPNRNCRVDIGGVRRGDQPVDVDAGASNELGLIHVYGNVRELVKAGEGGYVSVGGGYVDGIEKCDATVVQAVEGPVAGTGFRLLRELS